MGKSDRRTNETGTAPGWGRAATVGVVTLLVGFGIGYVVGENQQVKPARTTAADLGAGTPGGMTGDALPPDHPPVGPGGGAAMAGQARAQAERLVEPLKARLEESPEDPDLLAHIGNIYFDVGAFDEAETWYERSLEVRPGDPNVMTDLAISYRNQGEGERALELLEAASAENAEHWQSLYNKIIVLHFDLHRHDEARETLQRVERMRESNPQIPDLAPLRRALESHQHGGGPA